MRKPVFCICEIKGVDQLRVNRLADQLLCFATLIAQSFSFCKSEISSLQPSYVVVQPCLRWTLPETQKTDFLTTQLK